MSADVVEPFLAVRFIHRQQLALPQGGGGITAVSAALHGLAYGLLHIVGPDHLGTLMSLSVSAAPRRAFWLGATWSLGHCAGMVAVGAAFVALEKAVHLDAELWEHIGDYIVGASMCLCGLYFLLSEPKYVQETEGQVSLRSCKCCASGVSSGAVADDGAEAPPPPPAGGKLCLSRDFSRGPCCGGPRRGYGSISKSHGQLSSNSSGSAGDGVASSVGDGQGESLSAKAGLSDYSAAFIGIAQGMCCPMGLVGIAFLASLPPAGVATFLIVFLLVSATGTGAFSCLWSSLTGAHTQAGAGGSTWARSMYRGSCAFTLVLGIIWIVANAFDALDHINFADAHLNITPKVVAH